MRTRAWGFINFIAILNITLCIFYIVTHFLPEGKPSINCPDCPRELMNHWAYQWMFISLTLISSVGILLRKEWARQLLIFLFVYNIIENCFMIYKYQQAGLSNIYDSENYVVTMFNGLQHIVMGLFFGWLIYKFSTEEVKLEFQKYDYSETYWGGDLKSETKGVKSFFNVDILILSFLAMIILGIGLLFYNKMYGAEYFIRLKYDKAKTELKNGGTGEAKALFEKIVSEYPNTETAKLAKNSLIEIEDNRKIKENEMKSQEAKAILSKAQYALEKFDIDEAESLLQKIANGYPSSNVAATAMRQIMKIDDLKNTEVLDVIRMLHKEVQLFFINNFRLPESIKEIKEGSLFNKLDYDNLIIILEKKKGFEFAIYGYHRSGSKILKVGWDSKIEVFDKKSGMLEKLIAECEMLDKSEAISILEYKG